MMADAKKQCPYKIPINKKFLYCAATHCLADCKKQHGADAMVVVPKKRDFVTALLIVRVLAKCCEYNNIQPKFYIISFNNKSKCLFLICGSIYNK